ncbi:MAG: hypothetical protein ACR2PT_21970 [Endozoicomonas sp.]
MSSNNHVVLIKNIDANDSHRRHKWEVRSVKEVLNAEGHGSIYLSPLELAPCNDQESVNALGFMATAMNTDRKTEKFWLHYAGLKADSGRRLDYARQLISFS